jgi:hypothetical protein
MVSSPLRSAQLPATDNGPLTMDSRGGETSQPRPTGGWRLGHPRLIHRGEQRTKNREQRPCRFCSLLHCSLFWPQRTAVPVLGRLAKRPTGTAAAAQCVTMRGSLGACRYRPGVSEPVGVGAPTGSCCFQLDELPAILLRSAQSVKYYLTPVAIGWLET